MIDNEFLHISQKSQKSLARVILQSIKLSQLLFRRVAAPTEMTYLVGQLASWMAYGFFWQITIMISNVFSQISHNLGKRSFT